MWNNGLNILVIDESISTSAVLLNIHSYVFYVQAVGYRYRYVLKSSSVGRYIIGFPLLSLPNNLNIYQCTWKAIKSILFTLKSINNVH